MDYVDHATQVPNVVVLVVSELDVFANCGNAFKMEVATRKCIWMFGMFGWNYFANKHHAASF
ncbi:MAG: hypothetical protein ACK4MH_10185 [Brevundimonas sp.]|uniref:hypothetical protein n=1 Tax=Brevundimonas sp. TaxID=1871086 RepID=UPI003919EF42